EYAVRLSGVTKKLYQSNLKAMECLLGLEHTLGLRELGVQYGCHGGLLEYKKSLPSVQQQDVDVSKPLFTTTALYSACKCLKIKVDKKLAGSSGAKKAVFDRLSVQFQTFGQDICKEVTTKTPQKKALKRLKPMENIEARDDDCLSSSLKQQREREEEEDDEEEGLKKTAQNYEEWKRKILENALKANAETCDS
ncbi:hypothetical protein CRUP_021783, partial [Coryphaenoides rupestris]